MTDDSRLLPTDRLTCPICTGPKGADEPECSVCRDEPRPDAYTAILETEACARCHEGETWTVKGPDGLCIGQSWAGDGAEANAIETAEMLNAAFELGKRSVTSCLIAAAPELLAVVREMAQYGGGMEFDEWRGLVQRADAAIAKAEGRTPDPIGDKLRSLPVIGVLNVDDPKDPRHKDWTL